MVQHSEDANSDADIDRGSQTPRINLENSVWDLGSDLDPVKLRSSATASESHPQSVGTSV